MNMQKGISISLFVSLAVLVSVTVPVWATGITGRTYVNEEYNFQISLPDDLTGWTMTDLEPELGLVVIEGFFELMAVDVEVLLEPTSLEEFVDLLILFMPFMWDEWELESEQKIKIDGVDAYEIVYAAELEGFELRFIQYVFFKGDYGYTIIGSTLGGSFPFPFDAFRSIVATFEFLDTETPSAPNAAPVISSEPMLTVKEGMMYIYDIQATDGDGDPLTYNLATAPPGMSIDPGTGMIVWTPSATEAGVYTVTVEVSDGRGGLDTQSFTLNVTEALNVPPLISSIPVTAAAEGEAYVYNVDATDDDNDSLTYSLISSPSWMTIDASTGLISWTPSGTQAGNYAVVIDVSDGRGGSVTQSFTVDVAEAINNAPIITSIPATTAAEGVLYQYTVEAMDADGDPLTFGLVTFPDGVMIDANTGLVSWTPTNAQVGNSNMVVQADDGRGGVDKQSFTISVTSANTLPEAHTLAVTPGSPSITEDLTCSYIYLDADGDAESGSEIRWYKDGELQESYNDQMLVLSAATAAGQQWHFTVKPKDGADFGALQISDPVSVTGIRGDVSGDGELRSNDAILTLRIVAGLMEPTDQQRWAADMNDDGNVRSNDAILMLREVAGLAAPGADVIADANAGKQITIALAEAHGVAGERIVVPLKVDSVHKLAGGDIRIAYDSAVLRAIDVLSDTDVLLASNMAEPGIIQIAFAGVGELNSKTLAEIRFDVIADDISPLALKSVELYSPNALPLNSRCIDKRFSSWAMASEYSALLQNFPNPFNPETWIPYQLREDSEVTIRIYSISGELVQTLELGYKPAGLYISSDRAAHWDGTSKLGESVASGIYFYSIQAGDFAAVRKLTVLK